MINIKCKLQAIEDTIDRLVTRQVLDSIKLHVFGFNREINYYYNEHDKIHKKKDQAGELKAFNGLHHEFIEVETIETPFQDHDKLILNTYPDQYSFYNDLDIGAKFTTVVHNRKLSLNLKYYTKSKSDAIAIISLLRAKPSMDGFHYYHQLEYSYIVPLFLVNLLKEINSLKNKRYPEDKKLSLMDYISRTFDNRLDLLNPVTGDPSNVSLVIREAQVEVNGIVETNLYEIEMENQFEDNGYYVIPLEYYIVYEKPVSIVATYPMMVYNSPIAKPFLKIIPTELPNDKSINTKSTKHLHALIDANVDVINKFHYFNMGKNYVTIPFEDKHYGSIWVNNMVPIFSVLNIIDINNPTFLFNIKNDLDRIELKKSLVDFILKSERKYMTKMFRSFLYAKLFVGQKPVSANIGLEIKEDGDIVSKIPLDITQEYRTCLYFVQDLDLLYLDDKIRIRKYLRESNENTEVEEKEKLIDTLVSIVANTTNPNPAGDPIDNLERLKGVMKAMRPWFPAKTVNVYSLTAFAKFK